MGFKVTLLDINIPQNGGFEAFKKKVYKVLPCSAIKTPVVLVLLERILDIFEEVSLGINDF